MANYLFNELGNDFIEGLTPVKFFQSPLTEEPTGLITIFDPRDPVIYEFVKLQKQRLWKADEYPIDRTKEGFDELSDIDKQIFEYTLSFLAFLDSVQIQNISDLQVVYNLPEYKLWGVTHNFFEAEHAIAYSNILYGLFNQDPKEVRRIFYLAKDYPELRERNRLIAQNYNELFEIFMTGIRNVSPEQYARALLRVYAGTYAMEAVTFYMGFKIIEFYQYKYGVLPMTNKMISEIKADELFHVKVGATIIKRLIPYLQKYLSTQEIEETLVDIIKAYTEADLQFYQSILQTNSFGITQKQIEHYVKYLANIRTKLVLGSQIGDLYPEAKENPFEEIDRLYGYLDKHDNSGKKESFFETKSSAYLSASIDDEILSSFEF